MNIPDHPDEEDVVVHAEDVSPEHRSVIEAVLESANEAAKVLAVTDCLCGHYTCMLRLFAGTLARQADAFDAMHDIDQSTKH